MTIESTVRKQFKKEFSLGHVNVPLLKNPMALGDLGQWGPVQGFRRSRSIEGTNARRSGLKLRPSRPTKDEIQSNVTIEGSLRLDAAGAGSGGAGKGSAKVTFHDETSFYLFAPRVMISEYDSPELFGQALWDDETSGARTVGRHAVYRVVTVTSGIFVASRKANTTATIDVTYTNPAQGVKADGSFTVSKSDENMIITELEDGGEPVVIAYDMVRWGVRGRVIVNPLV